MFEKIFVTNRFKYSNIFFTQTWLINQSRTIALPLLIGIGKSTLLVGKSGVIAESVAELEKGDLAASVLLRKLHFSFVIEKVAHLCLSTFSQKMWSGAKLPP